MSIINLEKTVEYNQLLYCNLGNIIIECLRLTELSLYKKNNTNFKYFSCNKVKIITIYDIYKNVIHEPIKINSFEDPIKVGVILENLKEKYYFSKTFIESFIINNKLNNIQYNINKRNTDILYDNIEINLFYFAKVFTINNDKKNNIDKFFFTNDYYCIKYNKKLIYYYIKKDYIAILKKDHLLKKDYKFKQHVFYNKKNLKIIKIEEFYKNITIYEEERNDNNEITMLEEHDNTGKIKEKNSIYDNTPPFSKQFKNFCIKLNNCFNENIINYFKIVKFLFKKDKELNHNLLLNYNLEMINFK